MSTEIQPVPDVVLADEFPTLADRPAGTYNQKSAAWANSENAMSIRNREIAVVTHNNATAAREAADIAAPVAEHMAEVIAAPGHAATATAAANSALASRNDAAASASQAQRIVWEGATGYPKSKPTLLLDYANSQSFRDGFVRATEAPGRNSWGRITTVSASVPRIIFSPESGECVGLLVEEVSTNLLTWSDDGAQQTPSGGVIVPNSTLAPDGSNNAWLLRQGSVPESVQYSHTSNTTTWPTDDVVLGGSVFLKYAGQERVSVRPGRGLLDQITVNILTGEVVNTGSSVLNYSLDKDVDDWWRIKSIVAPGNTTQAQRMRVELGGYNFTTPGDGVSGVHIWRPQLEDKGVVTSPIKTEASEVTRVAEIASISGSRFTDFFNPLAGTFVVEWVHDFDSDEKTRSIFKLQKIAQLSAASAWRGMGVEYIGARSVRTTARDSDRDFNASSPGAVVSVDAGINKSAFFYTETGFCAAINGNISVDSTFTPEQDFRGFLQDLVIAYIGAGARLGGGGNLEGLYANKPIRSVNYYPRALSRSELMAITS